MRKVLITAPLRQEPKVFIEYQKGLDRLIIPEGVQVDRYFVVNDCPEIIPYIHGAEYDVCDMGLYFEKVSNAHIWTLDTMLRMSELRNMTIRKAMEGGYDYWFSIDTDLILQPETLKILLEADKDIVSEIFWTKTEVWWCNAWMEDQCTGFRDEWKEPGLYRCGMTGALTLVKRKVFEAGVDYTRIPNIRQALRGEDRHFCVRAACAGFEMWIDSHAPARHLYTETEYNRYMMERGE